MNRFLGLKNRVSPKFFRYVVVGFVSLGVDYGSFIISYYLLSAPLRISVFIGLILGFIVNFSMNKFWAFNDKEKKDHHPLPMQLVLYGLLFSFNYVFTFMLIHFLQKHGMPASIGKIVSTIFITIWNYFIYKLAIFKNNVDVEVITE